MFFGQLFERLQNPKPEKSPKTKPSIRADKPEINRNNAQFFLSTNNHLSSNEKLNQGLEDIDKDIKKGQVSTQLYLQKADILLRKGKIRKARQILNELTKKRIDSKTKHNLKKLLETSRALQHKDALQEIDNLFSALHKISAKYQINLTHIPITVETTVDLDIASLIRQEAKHARTCELPKLSYELIEKVLEAGYTSPWLLHDKAVSLNMLGQPQKALEILEEIKKTNKGEKLASSINNKIRSIIENQQHHQFRSGLYLAKQALLTAKKNSVSSGFIPEINQIDHQTDVKHLVFKQTREALENHPQASLDLANTILDFFPGDLAALQLKGEALAALKRSDDAIKTWKSLTNSDNEIIAKTASILITENITNRAKIVSKSKSSKAAICFFIQQHLRHNLSPTLSPETKKILRRVEPSHPSLSDSQVREHQLQLLFNSLVVECLEARWRKQGRLDTGSTAQKPGTIRKTDPKAG